MSVKKFKNTRVWLAAKTVTDESIWMSYAVPRHKAKKPYFSVDEWKAYVLEINKRLLEYCMENGEVRLPSGVGIFAIRESYHSYKINFDKTKKLKKDVFYANDYSNGKRYRLGWTGKNYSAHKKYKFVTLQKVRGILHRKFMEGVDYLKEIK